ncbi:hypothetical protein ACFXCR_17005 [Streptomyces sp. NPDC059431]|uniref:hypothetical protein n=1 Tax=Streptomyces sp. NPDC059431 TaxID=3346828 RepID=UPI00367D8ACC
MKPRTVLKAVALATMPLLLATPAQAAAPRPSQELGDGIAKSFADIMDLDAGILAIASGILNINGKEGIIAAPGKLLGNSPPKTSKLDAADQKLLPTDIYKPTRPAAEQDGVKFHNVDKS